MCFVYFFSCDIYSFPRTAAKKLQTGWLKKTENYSNLLCHSSGGQQYEIKVSEDMPSEGSRGESSSSFWGCPGARMFWPHLHLCLHPHTTFPLSACANSLRFSPIKTDVTFRAHPYNLLIFKVSVYTSESKVTFLFFSRKVTFTSLGIRTWYLWVDMIHPITSGRVD